MQAEQVKPEPDRNGEEPSGGGNIGPAENWRGDKMLAKLGMFIRQALRERDADRARGNMERATCQICDHPFTR